MDADQKRRISIGNSKVQIDELKRLIKSATDEGQSSIILDFELQEGTRDWLFDNHYDVNDIDHLYVQTPFGFQPSKIEIKISW